MLSVEANERLTRVGPGTPMGELMRRYWLPIAPASELLLKPTKKVRVLGETLTLYRDKSGTLGLIGERCPHRNVDLQYGYPETNGLRCPYHGWLYNESGECLETPLEPIESRFREKVEMPAYPVRDIGGLIYAYLGPEPVPVLPPWDVLVWPNAVRQIGVAEIPCNWLQCQENAGDPAHGVYLHGNFFKYVLEYEGLHDERVHDKNVHRAYRGAEGGLGLDSIYARPTPYGMEKGERVTKARGAPEDRESRAAYVIFPFYTRPGGGGIRTELQARVPMDDTHTYHINYQMYAAPPGVEAPRQDIVPFYEMPMVDDNGRPIFDYVLSQDMLAWWSQGAVTNRSRERLGTSDVALILMRRMLEENVRIVERGGDPKNVFRDRDEVGEIIHLTPRLDNRRGEGRGGVASYRAMYHLGYDVDDGDRYGPAMPLVKELMQRAQDASAAATT